MVPKLERRLRGPFVVAKQAAEPLMAFNRAAAAEATSTSIYQAIAQPLVISLAVVVLDVLPNDLPQMALSEWDHLGHALRLRRPNEPFGVGVQIRTARREPHRVDACALQRRAERFSEKRVAIVDQVAGSQQKARFAIDQIPRDLAHPRAIWRW